ncbi:aldehyde dehydrogenase family protein [Pseudomaricurvus alcaniphilus]|nr:aldehyde dehydrogenase family protein [Pseudomaricurvus alcaniphilus]
MQLPDYLYIDGEKIRQTDASEVVINPADESVLGHAPLASTVQTEAALEAARVAFDRGPWPRMSIKQRVGVMQKFQDYLRSKKAEIVQLIVAEAGSTLMQSDFMQYELPMKHVSHLLDDALQIRPEMIPVEITPAFDGSKVIGTSSVNYEPVGVVAAITPYNFPFFLNIGKVFHALLMGNTMVLKPSPLTPYQALILADAADAAGIPAGVLNIINGGIETGNLITSDKRVDMVSFTGSDKVGAAIAAQAAPTLKKTHMELGGKSAFIVRQDADLAGAVQAGLTGFITHCGQGCALTTRHLVHNAIRPQYVAALQQAIAQVKVGNPADASVMMGPLIRENARARVEQFVQAGLDSGAKLMAGGKRPAGLDKGFYFEPTFFDDVDNGSMLAQQEAFGPIAAVIGFDSDEEAIELANDSDFGLSGHIYSADAGTAYEMALQLRTGGVGINNGAGTMLSSAPFGGYKRSGYGREFGRHGLLDFCQIKSIAFQGR